MADFKYGTPAAEEFLKQYDLGTVVEDVEAEAKSFLEHIDPYTEYIENYGQKKEADAWNKRLEASASYVRKTGRKPDKVLTDNEAAKKNFFSALHHSDIRYRPQLLRDRKQVVRIVERALKAGAVREDVMYTPEEFGAEEVPAVKLTIQYMTMEHREYYPNVISATEDRLYLYRKGEKYYIYLETDSCQIV